MQTGLRLTKICPSDVSLYSEHDTYQRNSLQFSVFKVSFNKSLHERLCTNMSNTSSYLNNWIREDCRMLAAWFRFWQQVMNTNSLTQLCKKFLPKELWLSLAFLHSYLTSLNIYGGTWRLRALSFAWQKCSAGIIASFSPMQFSSYTERPSCVNSKCTYTNLCTLGHVGLKVRCGTDQQKACLMPWRVDYQVQIEMLNSILFTHMNFDFISME